jgi:predicted DNA-binding transcriptional regulator YafY
MDERVTEDVRRAAGLVLAELHRHDEPRFVYDLDTYARWSAPMIRRAIKAMRDAGAPIVTTPKGYKLERTWTMPVELLPREKLEQIAEHARAQARARAESTLLRKAGARP